MIDQPIAAALLQPAHGFGIDDVSAEWFAVPLLGGKIAVRLRDIRAGQIRDDTVIVHAFQLSSGEIHDLSGRSFLNFVDEIIRLVPGTDTPSASVGTVSCHFITVLGSIPRLN